VRQEGYESLQFGHAVLHPHQHKYHNLHLCRQHSPFAAHVWHVPQGELHACLTGTKVQRKLYLGPGGGMFAGTRTRLHGADPLQLWQSVAA
jgi:hypothetical protein